MYDIDKQAFIAISGNAPVCLIPKMANRHGLITGATGTGKTVTLQTMAETFSQMGVPVFAADVKGDLSGVAAKGGNKQSVVDRVAQYGLESKGFAFQSFPVQFWDVFGESGAPVRATVSDMGPLLLSRLLTLNDTQSSVLTLLFKIAQDENLALIDLKDMQKIVEYVADSADKYTTTYGNIATASLGAIQRGIVALGHDGADRFFGEPALNIDDLIQTDGEKGVINILAADKLMQSPKVYTTFLLWLMNKLFDVLPEVGDRDKPKLVFFFDEAHLVFNDAPKALVEKIEQVVRLIRSKGVGIYFISQTPSDMPDSVLSQLGNRVQHALRAYTPKDQKALKAAAQSFRANPAFDTEKAISELGTGEALLSFLDAKGAPIPVERGFILPPQGQIGPLDGAAREQMVKGSLLYRHYAEAKDRESAFEIISKQQEDARNAKEDAARQKEDEIRRKEEEKEAAKRQKEEEKIRKEEEKIRSAQEKEVRRESEQQKKFWINTAKSVFVPLVRQALGSLFKRR
ncbi:putative ATPase [uncultured delta proteobacterium]|uniref:Putative ATPase n=1 Tax=uncultured delta proteobacterium TaxID=34034 RepID=A0A212JL10_9DELT|nr:putative ATPase [uncultured delta proteobacterium]